jgi:hypothetical protein
MFSDAVDREAAWLSSYGDGLPTLIASQGGPYQILQPRWPRTPSTSKTGLYVLRASSVSYQIDRFAAVRSMPTTQLMLRLVWPLTSGQGSAEADQLAFEQSIDLVLTRIEGLLGDKTHGGRFLSVGEGRGGIVVNYDDVETTMQSRHYRATITYTADDVEFTN